MVEQDGTNTLMKNKSKTEKERMREGIWIKKKTGEKGNTKELGEKMAVTKNGTVVINRKK